jgi:hypothetical protein
MCLVVSVIPACTGMTETTFGVSQLRKNAMESNVPEMFYLY